MSEGGSKSRRLRLRSVAIAAGLLAGVAIVVLFDPLGTLVRELPRPDLPAMELPDLPAWVKWAWRGIVVAAVALAVMEAVRADKSERSEPTERSPRHQK